MQINICFLFENNFHLRRSLLPPYQSQKHSLQRVHGDWRWSIFRFLSVSDDIFGPACGGFGCIHAHLLSLYLVFTPSTIVTPTLHPLPSKTSQRQLPVLLHIAPLPYLWLELNSNMIRFYIDERLITCLPSTSLLCTLHCTVIIKNVFAGSEAIIKPNYLCTLCAYPIFT